MNDAHLHLVVNHLPIIIPIAGLAVLASGFILKSEVVKRVAYFLFVIAAICTMPVPLGLSTKLPLLLVVLNVFPVN